MVVGIEGIRMPCKIDKDTVVRIEGGSELGAEGALQNHQVLTRGTVHIIQSDGRVVCSKPPL